MDGRREGRREGVRGGVWRTSMGITAVHPIKTASLGIEPPTATTPMSVAMMIAETL